MTPVAISAPSRLATNAAATVVKAGGNAVDTALAAIMMAMISEPGICSPGAGAFITIGGTETPPIVIDGYMEMPGRGLASEQLGRGMNRVETGYGGGTTMLVGPGTIATPGVWAAMGEAWARYGQASWSELMAPTIRAAQQGCPLPPACHSYLEYTHQLVYGHDPVSYGVLHRDQQLIGPGELVIIPGLAESMRRLSEEGPRDLYSGELANQITTDILDRGGILTEADLDSYQVEFRDPHGFSTPSWELVTNPAPAVGGLALSAMLDLAFQRQPQTDQEMVEIQQLVWEFRRHHVDEENPNRPQALAQLSQGDWLAMMSPSTVHVSAVDQNGLGCAITASSGYGSGIIPTGTGIWMNNGLGEIELVGKVGQGGIQPGERLLSNMAPSLLLGVDGEVIAAGSPGADRITSALFMVLGEILLKGTGLTSAVSRPRAHVEWTDTGPQVAHEPGIELNGAGIKPRPFADRHMFFGGVGMAARHRDGRLEAVADPRRNGQAVVLGG